MLGYGVFSFFVVGCLFLFSCCYWVYSSDRLLRTSLVRSACPEPSHCSEATAYQCGAAWFRHQRHYFFRRERPVIKQHLVNRAEEGKVAITLCVADANPRLVRATQTGERPDACELLRCQNAIEVQPHVPGRSIQGSRKVH